MGSSDYFLWKNADSKRKSSGENYFSNIFKYVLYLKLPLWHCKILGKSRSVEACSRVQLFSLPEKMIPPFFRTEIRFRTALRRWCSHRIPIQYSQNPTSILQSMLNSVFRGMRTWVSRNSCDQCPYAWKYRPRNTHETSGRWKIVLVIYFFFFMSLSASSYFHRFLIVNTVIATIFWCWFLLPEYFPSVMSFWVVTLSITTLFGLLSFTLYYWKSWRYSIADPSFSALKTGLRISLSWMAVWDMLLLWTILIDYFQNPGSFYGLFIDNLYSFWERSPEEFGPFIALWIMVFLLLLPIFFSLTGFYLDRRKNKISFPWSGMILFFGIIILFFWVNIGL